MGWGGVGGVGGHVNVPCTSCMIYCHAAEIFGIVYYVTCADGVWWGGVGRHVNVPCTSYMIYCHAAEISGIVYYVTCCYAAEISGMVCYVTWCYAAEISGMVYYVTCCYAAEISGIVYYVTCCYAAEISGIVYYVTCCYAAEISGIVYYVTLSMWNLMSQFPATWVPKVTTTPSWPCPFLPFWTLFMFSCKLSDLSHATLLAFICVCALLRCLSLLGAGGWEGRVRY